MKAHSRRRFLGNAIRLSIAAGSGWALLKPATCFAAKAGDIPRRKLGRTGLKVSIIGLGGWHIGIQKDPTESVRLIQTAIDGGINFLDNSWDYNDGQSEIRMGKAIKGRRDQVILMTKFTGCETMERIEQALTAGRTFKPMSKKEIQALEARSRPVGETGKSEPYKITTDFDNRPSATPPPYEA